VENEEMSEYTIVDALAAAARRGVDVEVVMTYQSSWRSNFDKLAEAGVHVRTYSPDADLYIHAKVIEVDPGYPDEQLELGSQNFSWASLQYNRELGVDLGAAQARHSRQRGGHRALRLRRRRALDGLNHWGRPPGPGGPRFMYPCVTTRASGGIWQTRRIQVPVSARTWGFKSPLAHPV
jgi:hypothetical protein